ncbi:DUF4437 domain-containing protein [Roseimaritima ulvae]|uniref:ChrR Cupin-like domain protein n=1 Tax=Roseimaritima ulvae TaxID=980254 RepID=A0A5B9QVW7_9BACT|nr:DUF4437 domain-containing protein [Roseimaritima ulvae]QEG43188.1 ChrR Cupin-like domain protein [Roseimaritima ulvae]
MPIHCRPRLHTLLTFGFLLVAPGLSWAQTTTEIVLPSEIQWQFLNPARGDAAPSAGTLWGDQTQDGESGFLVKFKDGFSSPPHIHNITYRGIVIAGKLHNDDPQAEPMWMPAGSWWVQPAGEVHITAAQTPSVGYVEIQSGPYLVKAPEQAFDNGERPINVDATNIVWLDAADTTWIEEEDSSEPTATARLTFLWGNPDGEQAVGTMLKLPAGFEGQLQTNSPSLRVVVIEGLLSLQLDESEKAKALPTGSYFGSSAPSTHHFYCDAECLLYVRTKGKFTLKP